MKKLETPKTELAAFIAKNATIVGRVELAKDSSVWFGAILRGDNDLISIGEATNVQDGTIIHTDDQMPLRVGARVTIGHAAVLHGCTVGDESLIGIGAVLLNGSHIPRHCVVGARAPLVTGGKNFSRAQPHHRLTRARHPHAHGRRDRRHPRLRRALRRKRAPLRSAWLIFQIRAIVLRSCFSVSLLSSMCMYTT